MNTLTETLASVCSTVKRTGLADMESVHLMRRFDAKYVVPEAWLPELVESLAGNAHLLEVAGEVDSRYENLYYELPGDPFLTDHLRGRARRMKVRERRYVSNDRTFLEAKRRFPGGKTEKVRVERAPNFSAPFTAIEREFIREHVSDDVELEPRLLGTFQRLTLVDFDRKERLTLDRGLTCGLVGQDAKPLLEGLAIIEVKQPRPDRYGPAQRWLRSRDKRQGVVGRKTRVSKYTMARLTCDPDIAARTYLATYRRLQDARSWAEDLQTQTRP